MSLEQTRETLTEYLDTLAKRGPYGRLFADDITLSVMGAGQEVKGRVEVEQFIRYFHEQAFDARPEVVRTFVVDGHAAVELEFIGTHTGEFMGVAATGHRVHVPYVAAYDLAGSKLTAIRLYVAMEQLIQQIRPVADAKQPA
jgi:predicted ester cyclase